MTTETNKTATAIVQWLSHVLGGRTKPPSGNHDGKPYCAPILFLDAGLENSNDTTWSLFIDKTDTSSSEYVWSANIWFLVDKAPHHELTSGRQFGVYEGKKLVAIGKIT